MKIKQPRNGKINQPRFLRRETRLDAPHLLVGQRKRLIRRQPAPLLPRKTHERIKSITSQTLRPAALRCLSARSASAYACQHAQASPSLVSNASAFGLAVSQSRLRPHPTAHDVPLLEEVGYRACRVGPRRLAESEGRRAKRADKRGASLSVLTSCRKQRPTEVSQCASAQLSALLFVPRSRWSGAGPGFTCVASFPGGY